MKSPQLAFGALLVISLSITPSLHAQGQGTVKVIEGAICKNVVDRVPVEPGNVFSASVAKLYCFTEIAATEHPTEVTHVWYFGDVERATVTLPIKSLNWRTYSSKTIQSHEIGPWRVEVRGPDGSLIETLRFKVVY